jgi:ketosteroid isomerase-like protein
MSFCGWKRCRILPPMEYSLIDNWMELYEKAWRSGDVAELENIFTDNATYQTSPFADPVAGLENIQHFWHNATDKEERFNLSYGVVAKEGDIAVIKVEVAYTAPHQTRWKNLWIIQLDDEGRCFAFEEWPFQPGQEDGNPLPRS